MLYWVLGHRTCWAARWACPRVRYQLLETSPGACGVNFTALVTESNDPEFDDYHRRFSALESAAEKLLKDAKAFNDAVGNLFTNGAGFAQHFANIFHPLAGEMDITRKHPEAEHTIKHVDQYEGVYEELKTAVVPELELIESRIIGPMKELQGIMKLIRKTITKRDHKVILRRSHLLRIFCVADSTLSSLITIATIIPLPNSETRRRNL